MQQLPSRASVARLLLSYEPLQVLATLSSLAGLLSLLDVYEKNPPVVLVFAFCTLVLVARALQTYQTIRFRTLPSIEQCKHFFPFLHLLQPNSIHYDNGVIARPKEAAALTSIANSVTNHFLMISGKSGVGKSTFLAGDLQQAIGERRFIYIDEYEDFFETYLRKLRANLQQYFDQGAEVNFPEIETSYRKVITSYQAFVDHDAPLEILGQAIDRFHDLTLCHHDTQQKLVLVFDQAERILANFSDAGTNAPSRLVRLTTACSMLLDRLRINSHVIVLLAVRSDSAANCMTVVDSSSNGNIKVPCQRIVLVMIGGLNTSDSDVFFREMRNRFRDIGADFDAIQRTLMLASSENSNTFITQLTGYVAEHFRSEDNEIDQFLKGSPIPPDFALRKYFDAMIDGFALESAYKPARYAISTVLFTLACANHSSGNPISLRRVAQLSHLPLEDVSSAFDYLIRTGALKRADTSREAQFRLMHDQMIDYLMNSDSLEIRRDHREAIALMAAHPNDSNLFIVPRPIQSIFIPLPIGALSWAQIAIVAMIAFCISRLFFPQVFFDWFERCRINSLLEWLLPGAVQPFDFRWEFYLPIIVVQILWVTFMYYLDRGYFSYVLEKRKLRHVASSIAPLGGLFGCGLIFAPALFPIPITIGGIGLSILYYYHARSLRGGAQKNSKELGGKTLSNMVLSLGLSFVLYVLLAKGQPSHLQSLFTIWLFSAAFIWYWLAMLPRQGSQEGWSTLLSIFDRSFRSDS